MKQRFTYKLLMLVMLLMGMGSKIHAEDEVIFSADVIATSTVSFGAGSTTEITSAQATITGGTMYAINQQNGAKNLIATNSGSFGFCHTNNNTFFKVVLTKALAIGDVISSRGVTANGSERGLWISTAESRPNSCTTNVTETGTSAEWTDLKSYTIVEGDGLVGATTIYIYRASSNTTYFDNFVITRPENVVIRPAAPVFDPTGGTVLSGTTITCTTITDGAVVRYTTDGSDPTSSSTVFPSEGISITESTTFKAAAFKDGVSSDVKEASYFVRIPVSSLTAVSEHFWKFTDAAWNPSGATGAINTYENLYDSNTIELLATSPLANNPCNVTVDDITFTRELKMGGKSTETNRVLHFKVTGPSVITAYGRANGDGERSIVIATGSYDNIIKTEVVPTTGKSVTTTTTNTGETDIYVYCAGNAVNFFGIKVEPASTKLDLTQFEFNLEDEYLHDGKGTGKFITGSEIEYDRTYTQLRLKLKIQPDLELTDTTFTVTSSNSDVISAEGVGVWKAENERVYVGHFTVTGTTGSATISVTFNGNNDYNAKTITQEFTVVLPEQPELSYSGNNTVTIDDNTYPYIEIKTGGATGMLDLSVSPESYRDQVTYSWEPLTMEDGETMSSSSLITIDENGVVTTANKKGRALVTATIDHPYYGAITASYVVKVVISGNNAAFKYGDNILFDYYDGCVYTNPLEHYSGSLTWNVSDASLASVNSNGKVTVNKEGVVIVTARESNGTNHSYTLTLKANPRKYIVKEGLVPTVGQEITDVPGIKMTYGGFSDNFGKGSTHAYNQPGTTDGKTDKYSAAKSDANGLQADNFFFTTGAQDPRYESTDNSGNIRGWERIRVKTDYLSKTVPVYGTYYQFEPEMDGMLTVNVLQTGSVLEKSQSMSQSHEINTVWNVENGTTDIIDRWNYKALYLTDERGITIQAASKASHTTYSHPYIYPEVTREVDGETQTMPEEYRDLLSLKPHIKGTGLGGATYSYNAYIFVYGATYDNDGNNIAAESSSAKIKKEMAVALGLTADEPSEEDYIAHLTRDNVVHIMENERHGYWTLTQSNSVYTFPVKAGKTYYLYTDGSKLGLNSFTFVPDGNALTSTLEIDGSDTQTAATTLGEKNNCTITLNRTLKKDQPNSLVLPFSVSAAKVREVFGENTQVLHVESIDNCIHFVRHHHQMIVAGEPCIIYPSNATSDQWVFENVTVENPSLWGELQYVPVSGGGYTFTGCFEKTDMPAGSYYVRSSSNGTSPNNEDIYIYRVSKDDWMSNTRAFFQKGNANAGELGSAVVYNALEEGTGSDIDGIRIIQATEDTATSYAKGVYSISGQKMNEDNLQKGIYIVNGRKVVIK